LSITAFIPTTRVASGEAIFRHVRLPREAETSQLQLNASLRQRNAAPVHILPGIENF
jgi:hypothetical protein